jgi:hypothetical protein
VLDQLFILLDLKLGSYIDVPSLPISLNPFTFLSAVISALLGCFITWKFLFKKEYSSRPKDEFILVALTSFLFLAYTVFNTYIYVAIYGAELTNFGLGWSLNLLVHEFPFIIFTELLCAIVGLGIGFVMVRAFFYKKPIEFIHTTCNVKVCR